MDKKPISAAVVGLGYVGLPLSLQFAHSGVRVLGLDIDRTKVESLNQGRSYIKHISSEAVMAAVEAKRFSASSDFSRVKEVEAVIICVPTPLNKNREPDISFITKTGEAIAPRRRRPAAGQRVGQGRPAAAGLFLPRRRRPRTPAPSPCRSGSCPLPDASSQTASRLRSGYWQIPPRPAFQRVVPFLACLGHPLEHSL